MVEARYWDLIQALKGTVGAEDEEPPEVQADKIKAKILKKLEGDE